MKQADGYVSGFCMTGFHGTCPHVARFSQGTWLQKVCSCHCHPPTDSTDYRRPDPGAKGTPT